MSGRFFCKHGLDTDLLHCEQCHPPRRWTRNAEHPADCDCDWCLEGRHESATPAPVVLHPSMTLQQIAAWCAHHDREARISWTIQDDELRPVVTAVRAPEGRGLLADLGDVGVGMAWWNSLSEQERALALLAANSAVPADAWAHHCVTIERLNRAAKAQAR